jgi:hypothetical protein
MYMRIESYCQVFGGKLAKTLYFSQSFALDKNGRLHYALLTPSLSRNFHWGGGRPQTLVNLVAVNLLVLVQIAKNS